MAERRRGAAVAATLGLLLAAACGPTEERNGSGDATTTTVAAADTDAYIDGRFTSAKGGFSVALPERPRTLEQQERVGDVTLDVVVYDVAISDTEAYQISYVDYPDSLGDLDGPKVLDGAVDGAVRRTQGSLESRSAATLDGLPAADAEVSATFPIFLRVALSGRRLFTVQQIGPNRATETYDRLLETFRLEA